MKSHELELFDCIHCGEAIYKGKDEPLTFSSAIRGGNNKWRHFPSRDEDCKITTKAEPPASPLEKLMQ